MKRNIASVALQTLADTRRPELNANSLASKAANSWELLEVRNAESQQKDVQPLDDRKVSSPLALSSRNLSKEELTLMTEELLIRCIFKFGYPKNARTRLLTATQSATKTILGPQADIGEREQIEVNAPFVVKPESAAAGASVVIALPVQPSIG